MRMVYQVVTIIAGYVAVKKMLNWILVVVWIVLGIINLCEEKITKISYACAWIVAVEFLIINALRGLL